MIDRQLLQAIAEEFIKNYDSTFLNPVINSAALNNLVKGSTEFSAPDDIVFSFPDEYQIFNNADTVTVGGQFVGLFDPDPADPVGTILDYFNGGLTRFFPVAETTVYEYLPFSGTDDPEQDRIALRVKQAGTASQTGRSYEQPATIVIEVDEEDVNNLDQSIKDDLLNGTFDSFTQIAKVVRRVEFYANAYALHAAVLDSPFGVPTVPTNDPLTFKDPYQGDPNDPNTAVAIDVATQVWNSLAVGDLFTASTLHAPGAIWSFAITGPNFLPYVGTAQGFTSDGQPLAPDFSNAGAVLGNILAQLGPVVQAGDIQIVDTYAEGNRVLVHLREGETTLPIARETGNAYDAPLELLSWFTIEDGKVVSNEVIVNTFATVSALRPEETSPFAYALGNTRHAPPYFVTGSRVNSGLVAFDRDGKFLGVHYETNAFDAPELQLPIGITYGPDGRLFVNSTLGSIDNAPIINAVLTFNGVDGDYPDGTTQRNRESRERARDAVALNQLPRLQNVDPTRVADDPNDPDDQPNDYNPALFGDAHGEYYDPVTGDLLDPGSLTVVSFASGLNTAAARPINFATETIRTIIDPGSGAEGYVFADGENPTFAYAVPEGSPGTAPVAILDLTQVPPAPIAILDPIDPTTNNFIDPVDLAAGVYTVVYTFDPTTNVFTPTDPAGTTLTYNFITDPRIVFNRAGEGSPIGFEPVGLAIPGLVIPSGMKFGPDGNLYLPSAFTSRILQYDGETGEFLSVFATRENGIPVANLLDPALRLPPDFTVFVFGPDGGIYQCSIRTDINPVTGTFETETYYVGIGDDPLITDSGSADPRTNMDARNGYGAVLRYPGPTWAKVTDPNSPNFGWYIDPLNGNLIQPGQAAGIATTRTDLADLGVFGETGGILSEQDQPLFEPSAVAFGPDLRMYVSSAQTGQVLVYQGPLLPDGTPNPNAGRFDGVYADVGTAVKAETGRVNDVLVLSGLGFGPDGNLYVGSSFEQPQDGSENAGAPVAGSQWSVIVGPNPEAFEQTGNPGDYLGVFGDTNTEISRLLLPTTPEFVYYSNSYTHYNDPTERFPEIFYVVGVNSDKPFDANNGGAGFFQDDQADAIAAYDRDMNFLGYLGTPLVEGKLGQDLTGDLFAAELTASQEVTPPVPGLTAAGSATLSLNRSGSALTYSLQVTGLDFGLLIDGNAQTPDTADDVTGLHFHNGDRGTNGAVVFNILTQDTDDLTFTVNEDGSTTISGIWEETDPATVALSSFLPDLRSTPLGQDTNLYFNVHTNTNTGGEIRGQVTGFNPLSGIGDILLSAQGDILVSSQLTDQILRYNSLTGQYMGVFINTDFDNDPNTPGLNFPAGMAVSAVNAIDTGDADGRRSGLFVSDLLNGRILKFDGYTGEFYDDPATADVNEGVLAQLGPDKAGWRFTDLTYGPDGRIYVGLNSPLETPSLGSAVVQVYNPENNTLEQEITGFDFVAALTFGPDNRLYVSDDPASLVDTTTGQPLAPGKESRVAIYDVDYVYPILVGTDPVTGLPVGSPTGVRSDPTLVTSFNVGVGNAGAINVTLDQDTNQPVIFLSEPVSGKVTLYTSDGVLRNSLMPELPGAANGIDENGIPRPTGSAFISEFIRPTAYATLSINAPTDLAISATSVNENVPANTVIGTFSTTDPDVGDTFTYTLVTGTGDTDNTAFSINNNQLLINNSPDFEAKNSYSIRVKTTDQGGLSFEKALTITVNDLNETPTDLSLSATAVDENVVPNTVIGTLSTTDPDVGDTFIYTLVTGTGDTDNAAFSINNQLLINNSPDFEAKNSYSIRVKTTDQGGLSFEKALTLNINDINEASTGLTFNNALTELAEDTKIEQELKIADLSVEDDALGINNFFLTGRDKDRFLIRDLALYYVGGTLDFETQNSYEVTVNVDDETVGVTPDVARTFTLKVTDVNETPTAIALTNTTTELPENTNTSQGVKVADVKVTDDALGNNVLALEGTDAGSFVVRDDQLFFVGKADFEQQKTYDVTVKVSDPELPSQPAPTVAFTLDITNLPDENVNNDIVRFNDGSAADGKGSVVLDFSNVPGTVRVQANNNELKSTGAFFSNLAGLYEVANANGAVYDTLDLDGDGNKQELIQPGEAGYSRTALSNAVKNFLLRAGGESPSSPTTSASEFGDVLLEGGRLYAPFVIANGGKLGGGLADSLQTFLSQNPDNTAATLENFMTHAVAYFSFGRANPDGAEHLRSRGNNVFGFEDLPGNLNGVSDNDFNDAIFAFNFIG